MSKAEQILRQVKDGYNQIAGHFSDTRHHPWDEFNLFKEYIKDHEKILDAGCGNGRLYFSFLRNFNVEYYGIDVSEKLIRIAQDTRNKLQDTNKFQISNFKFQTADITDLPFEENQFDLVFCIATFHHLPDKKLRRQALAELYRVLKPGGYLLMTNWHLWHRQFLKHFFNRFTQKITLKDFFIPWKTPDGKIQCQRYYHAFTKDELKRLFKKSGLKIEKIFLHQNSLKREYGRGIDVVVVGKK